MKKVLASVVAMMFALVVAGSVFAAEPVAAPADNAAKVEKKAKKAKKSVKKAKKAKKEEKKDEKAAEAPAAK
ncbi:MAG TPA: hypothetical protein VGK27_02650 [Candidatus Deferrimicrobiaceae bacterium]|jgi:nitrate reductase cytochrome c-type subunit